MKQSECFQNGVDATCRAWRVGGVACALIVLAPVALLANTGETRGSRLAYALISDAQTPELVLAQRTIEREWGPGEQQIAVDVPDWRSEGIALMLSAAVPGTGQGYARGRGGWWFATVEAIGWAANLFFAREARSLRSEARRLAGPPSDPASAWSFDRWERSTGESAHDLEVLFLEDREVFMDRIGSDPRLVSGWAGDQAAARAAFIDARQRSEDRMRTARVASAGLWANHVLAAFDAVRQARRHNEPIEQQLELRFRSRWEEDGPVLTAALERRF